jgi:polar amino acid transport system substrate-binding protein
VQEKLEMTTGTKWFGATLGVLLACGLAMPASAGGDLPIMGWAMAPLTAADVSGAPSGGAIEIAKRLEKAIGVSGPASLVSTLRTAETAKTAPILIPLIGRTAEREDQYQWVGKIYDEDNCFLTLKGGPTISSLDDARKLPSIGVNNGGMTFSFLVANHFTNMDALASVESIALNMKKLAAGRVAAVFIPKTMGFEAAREAGLDVSTLTCAYTASSTPFWVAASKAVDPATFAKLKAAFDAMAADGTVKTLAAAVFQGVMNRV